MRRLVPVALILGSLLVGLLVTEACYRLMRRFVCVGAPTAPIYGVDSRYGWGHRPNQEGWWWGCLGREYEWRVYTRINSHGLRDREREYARTPGVARVLLLGDSITEAMQVPLEETFASRIEADLRARGVSAEVVNGAVASFGTDNELMFFRAEGVRYSPDVVLLVFNVVNDVSENSPVLNAAVYRENPNRLLPKTYFRLSPQGQLESIPMAQPTFTKSSIAWWSQIEDRFYLVRAIRRLLDAPPQGGPAAAPLFNLTGYGVNQKTPEPVWAESWSVTEAIVRELRREVESTGARFGVAVMPSREAVAPAYWEMLTRPGSPLSAATHDPMVPVQHMTTFLARERIPFVDLLPPLRDAAKSGATGFFGFDVHLNATGHERVAGALAPFTEKLLRSPAGKAP